MSEEATLSTIPEPDEDARRRRVIAATVLAIAAVLVLLLALFGFAAGTTRVPDLTGQQLGEAQQTISGADLAVGDVVENAIVPAPPGTVVEQTPPAGTRVFAGSPVSVVVATGDPFGLWEAKAPEASDADWSEDDEDSDANAAAVAAGSYMPNVLGMNLSTAREELRNAGYASEVEYGPSTTSVKSGLIFYQSVAPYSPAERGTAVVIWVSTGPPGPADRTPRPERP